MTVSVADFTADMLFKSFNNTAVKIMGHNVKELIQLEGENKTLYNTCFEQACLKQYLIKYQVNAKDYKGKDYKLQYNILSLVSIDPVVRAKKIYEIIGEIEDSLLS